MIDREIIQILRKLQKPQLQEWVLTADLRERFAECAEVSANSSDSEVKYGSSINSENRKALRAFPTKSLENRFMAAVAAMAAPPQGLFYRHMRHICFRVEGEMANLASLAEVIQMLRCGGVII